MPQSQVKIHNFNISVVFWCYCFVHLL